MTKNILEITICDVEGTVLESLNIKVTSDLALSDAEKRNVVASKIVDLITDHYETAEDEDYD